MALVCWLCYVKCPRGCWRRRAEKEKIKECAAQPSVVTWFAQGRCTCRTRSMTQHALEVHGVTRDELREMQKAAEYEHYLAKQAAVSRKFAVENKARTKWADEEREEEARGEAIAH